MIFFILSGKAISNTQILLAPMFARKFKEASQMEVKHQDIHNQFTSTFKQSLIKKWTTAIENWERNPKERNPYEEPDNGMLLV